MSESTQSKNNNSKFDYDVIFSLAGEKKDYVGKVTKYIQSKGIKVWFYVFKEVNLWGKNMVDEFDKLFTEKAKYCVVFISKEYVEKVWPNLEKQFIQSRWIKDPEYLLPVRFDNILVIGIPDTIAYINIQNKTPEEFGDNLIQKITGKKTVEKEELGFEQPKIKKTFNPYRTRKEWIEYLVSELEKRCQETTDIDFFGEDVGDKKQIRIGYKNETVYHLDVYKKGTLDDKSISFSGGIGEAGFSNGMNAFGAFEWSKKDNDIVLNLTNISLFDFLSGDSKTITKKEFLDEIWNIIVKEIETKY